MYLRVEVVAETGLALERTVTVGAPKVPVPIVLLDLCVSLEWLWASHGTSTSQRDEREERKMGWVRG